MNDYENLCVLLILSYLFYIYIYYINLNRIKTKHNFINLSCKPLDFISTMTYKNDEEITNDAKKCVKDYAKIMIEDKFTSINEKINDISTNCTNSYNQSNKITEDTKNIFKKIGEDHKVIIGEIKRIEENCSTTNITNNDKLSERMETIHTELMKTINNI